jgi:hypothetical protein
MRKPLYILAALLALTFVSADATSRPKSTIRVEYIAQENGDYKVYLFATDRLLVCEEKNIKIIQQGDAVNPLVFECKH